MLLLSTFQNCAEVPINFIILFLVGQSVYVRMQQTTRFVF
jgi:hypothetical protein